MRSFPLIIISGLVIIYFILSIIGFLNISITLKKHKRNSKILRIIYCAYSFIIIFLFVYLFVYPGNAADSTNYVIYFIFNVILVADIFSKFTITIFTIPYFILKLFGKTRTVFLYAGFIISIGVIISVIYGAFIGRKQLRVTEIEIEFTGLSSSFDGFRMLQLSDIHLGSFMNNQSLLNKAVHKINDLTPNIILLTGDLVNNFSYETEGWNQVFSKIKANFGMYAILGNHDYGDYHNWGNENLKDENFDSIAIAYNNFGFRLLRNETITIKSGGDSIFLVGVENWGHPPFPQYANLDSALKNVPPEAFKILMTHDPAHWEYAIKGKKNIELTFSGHTHGLQWGIKPAGIEFSLIYAGSKNWGGLYDSEGQYLYVNRGLGTIGLNLRLDMPADITVVTLKKK